MMQLLCFFCLATAMAQERATPVEDTAWWSEVDTRPVRSIEPAGSAFPFPWLQTEATQLPAQGGTFGFSDGGSGLILYATTGPTAGSGSGSGSGGAPGDTDTDTDSDTDADTDVDTDTDTGFVEPPTPTTDDPTPTDDTVPTDGATDEGTDKDGGGGPCGCASPGGGAPAAGALGLLGLLRRR